MDIKKEHIASKKVVGKLDGKNVFELATTGGLHLIIADKNGKPEAIGTGPHRAVSRYIAEKRNPEIQWTELSKADHIEPIFFQHLIPQYEELTDQLISIWG